MNYPAAFLILNLALAFYLVGAIWAHEVDIFRNSQVLDLDHFRRLQAAHCRKLPYWVFAPLALALAGSIILICDHPSGSPRWAILGNLVCQVVSLVLTAIFCGRWQAALARSAWRAKPLSGEDSGDTLGAHAPHQLLCVVLLAWVLEVLKFT